MVESEGLAEPFGLVSVGVEVLRVLGEQPARALEHLPAERVGFPLEAAAQFGELVVRELRHMEVVVDQDRLGEHFADGRRECLPHVRGDRLGLRPVVPELAEERFDAVRALPFGDMDRRAGVQVQDDAHVALALSHRQFVEGDPGHGRELHLACVSLQPLPLDLRQQVPAHAEVPGHILHRGDPAQFQNVPGIGTRVPLAGLRERQHLLTDRAALPASEALDLELQPALARTSGNQPEPSAHCPPTDHRTAMAAGTAHALRRVAAVEHRLPADELGAQHLDCTQAETVVEFASGGHRVPPVVQGVVTMDNGTRCPPLPVLRTQLPEDPQRTARWPGPFPSVQHRPSFWKA